MMVEIIGTPYLPLEVMVLETVHRLVTHQALAATLIPMVNSFAPTIPNKSIVRQSVVYLMLCCRVNKHVVLPEVCVVLRVIARRV
jgi:hypothetical protein